MTVLDDAGQDFLVVHDNELRLSVWPAGMVLPGGWSLAGPAVCRSDCLGYMAQPWCGMSALSRREGQGPGSP
jgi:uncharacterized protein YbdZ (MbtH family)